MRDLVLDEAALRVAVFVSAATGLALLEVWLPRRRDVTRGRRWMLNLTLGAVNASMVRFLPPAAGVTVAVWAARHDVGLFHWLTWPPLAAGILSVFILDLAVYAQHRAFHAVPLLWRCHRLHHADHSVDVTTGVRFHPAEIALSALWKGACIVALGAPPHAVVGFEVLLSLGSLFSHANVRVRSDDTLRLLLVTPDMHRIHHSQRPSEQRSNFGFSIALWDRVLGTYRAHGADPQDTMTIGLAAPLPRDAR